VANSIEAWFIAHDCHAFNGKKNGAKPAPFLGNDGYNGDANMPCG
jgi:hypothetical protein